MRRVRRANWRHILEELSTDPNQSNKRLWGMSKWSQKSTRKSRADPHLPNMRKAEGKAYTANNNEKAEILAAKLFPATEKADLRDINIGESLNSESICALNIDHKVSKKELRRIINWLPNNKAPGPDDIINEIIKIAVPSIIKGLAEIITTYMAKGIIPNSLKESITVVLRKESKKDYSLPGAYRFITLENTLAKLIKKIVTTHIMRMAEEK